MGGGIHPPLSVIGSWPPANLVDPVLRSNTNSIVIITFLVLAGLTIGARLWARGIIQRNLAFEDYLIIGAYVSALAMAIGSVLAMSKYGFDRHVWDAFPLAAKMEGGRKLVLAMECTYIVGTGLTKLSILLFVLRMTRHSTHRLITYAVWASIVFCSLTTVIFFILPLVECKPFSAFWHQVNYKWLVTGVKYKCLDEGKRVLSAGIFAVIQDVIVASLPLSTVWGLQMPTQQKMIVTAIFGGGYLSCCFGIMRLVYSYKAFYQTYDVTWEGAPPIFLWTNLELQIALICTSIPALKVFFKHYKDSAARSNFGYSIGRYPKGSSKLESVEGSSKSPGFYTQQLCGDDASVENGVVRVDNTVTVTSEAVSEEGLRRFAVERGRVGSPV